VNRNTSVTSKADMARKFDFNQIDDVIPEISAQSSTGLSVKDRMELDYLRKREPMKEFF